MNSLKRATPFALLMLPIAAAAGAFTTLYQLELYGSEFTQLMVEQLGSLPSVIVICAVQSAIFAGISALLGHTLAQKTGLLRPFTLRVLPVKRTLIAALVAGVLFSLDYWTFGSAAPQIRESVPPGLTLWGWLAGVLYGGVVEELLLRLMSMSLIAWLLWKLLWRNSAACPDPALIAANIIAALLFAAGHLPATSVAFGQLTPVLILRCFLLNGGFGLLFGQLYRKYGIQYSMLAHAGVHTVSKVIWMLFI